jgi:hypothetical protein
VNTYSIFAELSRTLVRRGGRAGCIVPSGIATDDTTRHFFADLMERCSLVSLYDFENRQKLFPSVDSRMKFCVLTMASNEGRRSSEAEFAFFLTNTDQLRDEQRRFALTAEDMALLNPNTRTCPIFRSRRDAELTKSIYRRVPVLIKEGPPEENPWGIAFLRMFDMSNDSGLFRTREQLAADGWRLDGNVFRRAERSYLPLYEGKMFQLYDHRAAGVETVIANVKRPGQPRPLSPAEHRDPRCLPEPQYWVASSEVETRLRADWALGWVLGFKDITSSTNERTVIPGILPRTAVGNNAPLILLSARTAMDGPILIANLSSFAFDFVSRFKVGGNHLNFFIFNQFAVLLPSIYDELAPWERDVSLSEWIRPRVLELTCTAVDMQPFARDLGYEGPPFPWDEERRFLLRCELDAAFFHLYCIARDDVDYIMDTFPIVKRKDEAKHGEYRTKRVILEVYDAMQRATETSVAYAGIIPLVDRPAAAQTR